MRTDPDAERLALFIATGKSVSAAARQAGLSERTARRRAADPAFKARVKAIRTEVTTQAVGRLVGLAVAAVDVFGELMRPGHDDGVRLRAAREALASLLSLRQLGELSDRVDDLEAAQAAMERSSAHSRLESPA